MFYAGQVPLIAVIREGFNACAKYVLGKLPMFTSHRAHSDIVLKSIDAIDGHYRVKCIEIREANRNVADGSSMFRNTRHDCANASQYL